MSLGIFDDLADSLAPWRTADLGCIAVRKVATEQPLTADEFESTGPTSLAEREEAAKKAREEAARQERGRSSLALIQLIQAAIERRETLLRDLGEGAGTPAEQAGALLIFRKSFSTHVSTPGCNSFSQLVAAIRCQNVLPACFPPVFTRY